MNTPMNLNNTLNLLLGIIFTALLIQSCSSYEPVPKSKCKAVVAHAKKTLGKLAPPTSEMVASCKKATDEERGCIMAADKPMKISSCM